MTADHGHESAHESAPASGPVSAGLLRRHGFSDGYSTYVRFMKVALPFLALVLVGVVLLLPQLESTEKKLQSSIKTQIKAQNFENLYMVKARYLATDEKSRFYTLTAESARQVSASSDLIALEGPKAKIVMKDKSKISMRSNAGAFYKEKKLLVLFGDVIITHSNGYTVQTNEMEINMTKGTARGTKPIRAFGPLGTLNATGFRILGNGKRVLFFGKARLTINIADEKLNLGAFVPSGLGKAKSGKPAGVSE
ncbi:MAG: LPS export ABC transporter periplasmic protein LptC [Alphaproteobacteria bacterium]